MHLVLLLAVLSDAVVLHDGRVHEGRVVYEDAEVVVLRKGSRDTEFERGEVAEVRSRLAALHGLLDRLDDVDATDADALYELAIHAEEAGLADEARLLHLWIVCYDPAHEAANEALGNKQGDDGWRYHHGRSWLPVDELPRRSGEWKERWTLATMHYELQTDVTLPRAIACAFSLERMHRAFFGLFAGRLRLLDVVETMPVQVHAESDSYPEPGNDRIGYFSPSNLTLFVLAERDDPRALAHEATHQLIHFTTQRTRGARGDVPSWLDEGLAEYFEVGLSDRSIGWKPVVGLPSRHHFDVHATHEDPHDLKRLLTMGPGDFMASKDAWLKYAQAYSLVHYLLHGDGGEPLEAFSRFAERAWQGKSSMSDFKKAIDVPLDDFEEAWTAYVLEKS